VQTERTYFGVISDAIEGCFAFDVEPDKYTVEMVVDKNVSYSGALGKAIEIEEKIAEFVDKNSVPERHNLKGWLGHYEGEGEILCHL